MVTKWLIVWPSSLPVERNWAIFTLACRIISQTWQQVVGGKLLYVRRVRANVPKWTWSVVSNGQIRARRQWWIYLSSSLAFAVKNPSKSVLLKVVVIVYWSTQSGLAGRRMGAPPSMIYKPCFSSSWQNLEIHTYKIISFSRKTKATKAEADIPLDDPITMQERFHKNLGLIRALEVGLDEFWWLRISSNHLWANRLGRPEPDGWTSARDFLAPSFIIGASPIGLRVASSPADLLDSWGDRSIRSGSQMSRIKKIIA